MSQLFNIHISESFGLLRRVIAIPSYRLREYIDTSTYIEYIEDISLTLPAKPNRFASSTNLLIPQIALRAGPSAESDGGAAASPLRGGVHRTHRPRPVGLRGPIQFLQDPGQGSGDPHDGAAVEAAAARRDQDLTARTARTVLTRFRQHCIFRTGRKRTRFRDCDRSCVPAFPPFPVDLWETDSRFSSSFWDKGQ